MRLVMEKKHNEVHCFIDDREVPLIECDTEHQKQTKANYFHPSPVAPSHIEN